MRKITGLFCAVLVVLLCLAGCNSDDPHKILKEALSKDLNTTGITYNGKLNISVEADEGMNLSVPGTLNILIPKMPEKPEETEMYADFSASVLGQSVNMKMWISDGHIYIDDGTFKTVEKLKMSDLGPVEEFNLDEAKIDELLKAMDPMTLTKDGDKRIIEATLSKDMIKKLMDTFGNTEISGELPEDFDMEGMDFEDSKITITVGEDKYISNASVNMGTSMEGMKASVTLDLEFKDRNNTAMPEFNKNEFIDSENGNYGRASESQELSMGDGKILKITCVDRNYHVYYNPSNQTVYVFRRDNALVAGTMTIDTKTVGQIIQYSSQIEGFHDVASYNVKVGDNDAILLTLNADKDNGVVPEGPNAFLYLDGLTNSLYIQGVTTAEEFLQILNQLTFEFE